MSAVTTYYADAFTSDLRWALLVLAAIAVVILAARAIRAIVRHYREPRRWVDTHWHPSMIRERRR